MPRLRTEAVIRSVTSALLVLASPLVLSCSSTPSSDAGDVVADAGVTQQDAGVQDAGVDAGVQDGGLDAGAFDAGLDAGVWDAGVDAGAAPDAGLQDAGAAIDAGVTPLFDGGAPRFSAGVFSSGPSLLEGRTTPFVVPLLDGRVLVAGGRSVTGSELTSVELLTFQLDGGALVSSPGALRRSYDRGSATRLADGRVLFAGGAATDAELFDPLTDTFQATGAMVEARAAATATLLLDGRVLFAGGHSVAAPLASAELFDPALDGGRGGFVGTGSLQVGRASAAAVLLPGGDVLVSGGGSAAGWLESVERFSADGGTFSLDGRMLARRSSHQAMARDDGTVLFIGFDAEWYLPGDGGQRSIGLPFQNARATPLSDGGLFLFSGRQGATSSGDGGWERLPMMSAAPHGAGQAVELRDGRVLVVGGSAFSCAPTLGSTELFDFSTQLPANRMSALPPAVVRSGFGLVTLDDGRVLIAGGYEVSGTVNTTASVEVYEAPPSTSGAGRWTPLAPLAMARSASSSARTGAGVLVLGPGVGELYDPSGPGASRSISQRLVLTETASMVTLRDGRALLVGGYLVGGGVPYLEFFEPRDGGAFSFGGTMTWSRLGATALQLPSGQVLIVGGGTIYNPLADELFDPADGGLSIIVGTDHREATGTLLADGRVFILNYGDGCGTPGSAELLDPVSMSRVALPLPPLEARRAVRLGDQVLLLGAGRAAVFSPDAGTFTTVAAAPFEGFSAVRLPDGRVLVVKDEYAAPTSEAVIFWQ